MTENVTGDILHSLIGTLIPGISSSEYGIPEVSTQEYGNNASTHGNSTGLPRRRFPPYSPPPLDWTGMVLIPLYSLIFILAVLGNVLVILTLIQNKRMRTVTNVFLLNLSISDLLLAVLCMPFTIIPVLLRNFIFGSVMCVLIRYLQGVSVGTSCFTLVAISLERYFAICRPLHSRKWQTLSHAYKILIVCWILAFILMIPISVYTTYKPLPRGNAKCGERWDNIIWEKAYAVIVVLLLLLFPVIIMCVAYGMISMTLWTGMKLDAQSEKEAVNGAGGISREESTTFLRDSDNISIATNDGYSSKTVAPMKSYTPLKTISSTNSSKSMRRFDVQRGMRQSNSEKSRAAKKRVIKMLFAVVYEFFICWTPLYFIQTWIILDKESAYANLTNELVSFINLLAYVSSCCNPITYCFMNRNFRQAFLSVFRCKRKRSFGRGKSEYSYSGNYPSMSRTVLSHMPSEDKLHSSSDKHESDEL